MKLKLLGAAATTTIAALISMPGQHAYADECIIDNTGGGQNNGNAVSEDDTALACGDDARAANGSVAIGENADAGYRTTPLGVDQTLVVDNGGDPVTGIVAVGLNTKGLGNRSTAIGAEADAGRIVSSNRTVGIEAVAVGYNAQATENSTTAIGGSAEAIAANATALGRQSEASATGAVAIGFQSEADVANTVQRHQTSRHQCG